MQMNRLFEMVYLLLNQKMITTKELASRFEVSKRTILRDIETLSKAGVPIYTTPGRGGGVSILNNFVLDKAAISDEEQNQILLALQTLGSVGPIGVNETLTRLQAFFDKADTNWIEVDFSRWGNQKKDQEKFSVFKTAIIKRRELAITYASSYGETTQRTVCPLKLVYKGKAWYLQAYCMTKEGYRTFKVNRILSMQLLESSFAGKQFTPPSIDDADTLPVKPVHLILRFSSEVAYRVYDEFDTKELSVNSDGSFTVTSELPEDAWLYGFLLSYCGAVQVLAPQHVKDRLLLEAEKIRDSILVSDAGG